MATWLIQKTHIHISLCAKLMYLEEKILATIEYLMSFQGQNH